MSKEEKRRMREDSSVRNSVEGKFGQGKRRFGLSRIMAKLQETSESVIWINIIVMNLERRLAVFLYCFLNHRTRRVRHLKQLAESIRVRWAAAF